MNDVAVCFQGREYHLLFNGNAMFAEKELFGKQGGIAQAISQDGVEGVRQLAEAFCLLAGQGELARRYEGHETQPVPNPEAVAVHALPVDLPAMRGAVMRAILKGYGREIEEDEIDLGLAEVQKKRKAR